MNGSHFSVERLLMGNQPSAQGGLEGAGGEENCCADAGVYRPGVIKSLDSTELYFRVFRTIRSKTLQYVNSLYHDSTHARLPTANVVWQSVIST